MCGRSERRKLTAKTEQRNEGTRQAGIRKQIEDAHSVKEAEIVAWESDSAREPWMVGEPMLTDNANVERQGESYVYVAKVDFEGAFGPIKGPHGGEPGDHVIFFQKYEPVSWGSSYFVKTDKILPVYVENIRCRNVQLGQIEQNARASRRHPTGQRLRLMLCKEERERVLIAMAEDRFDWYEKPNFSGQD